MAAVLAQMDVVLAECYVTVYYSRFIGSFQF